MPPVDLHMGKLSQRRGQRKGYEVHNGLSADIARLTVAFLVRGEAMAGGYSTFVSHLKADTLPLLSPRDTEVPCPLYSSRSLARWIGLGAPPLHGVVFSEGDHSSR